MAGQKYLKSPFFKVEMQRTGTAIATWNAAEPNPSLTNPAIF